MEQGNHEVARIHAENAIRQHNQYINFLRLASRMDAISQRLESARTVKNVCFFLFLLFCLFCRVNLVN